MSGESKIGVDVVVERDGRWYCTIGDCSRSQLAFDNARSAKSHPWAAHAIRSRSIESAKRRRRRYDAAEKSGAVPAGEPEELSPPAPMQSIPAKPLSVSTTQWKRGECDREEIEMTRRRMLYWTHKIAGDENVDPKRVLDIMRAILVPKPATEVVFAAAATSSKKPRVFGNEINFRATIGDHMKRDRWIAERVRAVVITEIDTLMRQTHRSRGAIIAAIREVVKDRLHRKSDALGGMDEEKAERMMALLRSKPGQMLQAAQRTAFASAR